jgi:hypothetical protein
LEAWLKAIEHLSSKCKVLSSNTSTYKKQTKQTKTTIARGQTFWLMPIILATPEAEIRRSVVQDHPWPKFHKTPISTNDSEWSHLPSKPEALSSNSRTAKKKKKKKKPTTVQQCLLPQYNVVLYFKVFLE